MKINKNPILNITTMLEQTLEKMNFDYDFFIDVVKYETNLVMENGIFIIIEDYRIGWCDDEDKNSIYVIDSDPLNSVEEFKNCDDKEEFENVVNFIISLIENYIKHKEELRRKFIERNKTPVL
ncbi:MAG: hypothetical protein AABY32_01330 [Nanoarchaeota archaeon]